MSKRPHWQEQGQEPDYRFSLANERTFLAWMRTALALLAAGVVLHGFSAEARGYAWWAAIGLAVCAAVASSGAYLRWRNNEIAMRHLRPLPRSSAIPVTAAVMAALAVSALLLITASP